MCTRSGMAPSVATCTMRSNATLKSVLWIVSMTVIGALGLTATNNAQAMITSLANLTANVTGKSYRYRSITVQMQFNGKACGATTDVQDCNTHRCPVDCELETWSSWGSCSRTCGGGRHTKTRAIKREAAHGGEQCGETSMSEGCGDLHCPVDCIMGDWSSWTACTASCGTGSQSRTRSPLREGQYNGVACSTHAHQDVQTCNDHNCPIDCKLGDWLNWGACSKTCGLGKHTRHRLVTVQPQHGGKACPWPHPMGETRGCTMGECISNCEMTSWNNWSSCSKSCNTGYQMRRREIKTHAAHDYVCPSTQQTQRCNVMPCAIDCQESAWGAWQQCDKSCGAGSKKRYRSVSRDAAFGGKIWRQELWVACRSSILQRFALP